MSKLPLPLLLLLLLSNLFSGTSQANLIRTPPPSADTIAQDAGGATLGPEPMDRGGIIVGNGGFVIQCTKDSPLQSYDFLAAQMELDPKLKVRTVSSALESLQIIRDVIEAKLPEMTGSFEVFAAEILANDPSGTYLWQPGTPWFSSAILADPSYLVAPCLGSLEPFPVFVQQAVWRRYVPTVAGTQIVLEYDAGLYYRLPDIQRSFLLVHEWLWNFTHDAETNSKADYLLHSTWIEKASRKEVIRKFKKLGIRYP